MMKFALAAAFAVALASPAFAQVTDPDMTCATYLKALDSTPTPKTGDADMDKQVAALEKKVRATCTADPKMKAMQAVMKAMAD
jgi:hypothetical protein